MKSMMRAGMHKLRNQQQQQLQAASQGQQTPGGTRQAPQPSTNQNELLSFKSLVSMMPSSTKPAAPPPLPTVATSSENVSSTPVVGDEQGVSGSKGVDGGKSGELPNEAQSVHMCFICLLYLANEHGLALSNPNGRLDSLMIKGNAIA